MKYIISFCLIIFFSCDGDKNLTSFLRAADIPISSAKVKPIAAGIPRLANPPNNDVPIAVSPAPVYNPAGSVNLSATAPATFFAPWPALLAASAAR